MRSQQSSRPRAAGKTAQDGNGTGFAGTPRAASKVVRRLPGYDRVRRTFDALLTRFENYLRKHALSPATIRNYLADLRAFSRWHTGRHRSATEFRAEDFASYREHLCKETDHSTATVNRRLQSLRLFGRFLQETGQLSENPGGDLELVHARAANGTTPRTLTPAEITRLTAAIEAGRPSLVARDHAIVQLMLQAGLRVQEVASLRVRDVVTARRKMSVDVRANRAGPPRQVPCNALVSRALREYLAARPAIPRVENLFVSQRGQPLSVRSIQRVIDTHARAAGLKDVCAQSLRHTCVRNMLDHTCDVALVARWLGRRTARGLNRYSPGRVNGN